MSLLALLIMETASIVAVVAAGILAFHDKGGWGWFLVVACLLTVSPAKAKSKDGEALKS